MLLGWLKIAAAVVAAAALSFGTGYLAGDQAGYERAQQENVKAAFDQLKERMETDADVADMPDDQLCALLGGVWSEGRCE